MCVLYLVRSVLDNKNGGPYLFYQRQFWSCVKVGVEQVHRHCWSGERFNSTQVLDVNYW